MVYVLLTGSTGRVYSGQGGWERGLIPVRHGGWLLHLDQHRSYNKICRLEIKLATLCCFKTKYLFMRLNLSHLHFLLF
jgi:hypothetical protein